MARAYS